MYLERTIQKEIPNLCKNFKVIMLSGMRQVGKSTLFSHLKESERKHINLDDFVSWILPKMPHLHFLGRIHCLYSLMKSRGLLNFFNKLRQRSIKMKNMDKYGLRALKGSP